MVALCIATFYTIDLLVGLFLDPLFLEANNLIGSLITAIACALVSFELTKADKNRMTQTFDRWDSHASDKPLQSTLFRHIIDIWQSVLSQDRFST